MNLIAKLLIKDTSRARLMGVVLSNFIGLLIVAGAVMCYFDFRCILGDEESVVNSDFLVVNKKVTSASTLGDRQSTQFSADDIAGLRSQPWVRRIGEFSSSDFRVYASVTTGGRGMETALFFESVPDDFVDVPQRDWDYRDGDDTVPIIIPKDYLALYNFGFANSAGLPQLSEQLISGIPLSLYMRSEDGTKSLSMKGRIAGFSRRLNTVLVPDAFMRYANSLLGSGTGTAPSRLIVDVSAPGDVAIEKYLADNAMEVSGDKSKSSAAYILKIVVGVVIMVGSIITILSLFVLMLSISLLMEKNRSTIHCLLMLGTPLREIGKPYIGMITFCSMAACILALAALILIRALYVHVLEGFGDTQPGIIYAIPVGVLMTAVIVIVNIIAVRRKIRMAWSLRNA